MPVLGARPAKWVFKIVRVSAGYDVFAETPIPAFYGHADTFEEAQRIAARQPTAEEKVRMLLSA